MRGVEHEHVRARFKQGGGAVEHVRGDSDGGAAEQSALRIPRGVRVLHRFFDVLYRYQALETPFLVDEGELLDLVRAEYLLRLLERRADRRGDEVILRHDLLDAHIVVLEELKVAVGDYADQTPRLDNRNAGDAELPHQFVGVVDVVVGRKVEGVGDDAVFTALYLVDLVRLLLDGHVFVDYADAAFARHGDSHARLGDGVHRGADYRRVEFDLRRKARTDVDLLRSYLRFGGNEQHVVKRERFFAEL